MQNSNEDEVIVTLRHSRKSFLFEYFCSFFLLSLVVFSILKGMNLSPPILYLFLGVGFTGLIITELRRYFGDRYKIMHSKLSVIKGVLKIRMRNIYYQPLGFVPDLNIRQTALQRVLNYGTLFVHVGNTTLELREIDRPNEVLQMLEHLIEQTKQSKKDNRTMTKVNEQKE